PPGRPPRRPVWTGPGCSCYRARPGGTTRSAGATKEGKSMRNTLAFLGALVLAVVALGWYLGWYQVFLAPGQGGHETVKVDIDTKKVSDDLKKGEEKLLKEGQDRL